MRVHGGGKELGRYLLGRLQELANGPRGGESWAPTVRWAGTLAWAEAELVGGIFLFSFFSFNFQSHFQNHFKNHFELFLNFNKTTQQNKNA